MAKGLGDAIKKLAVKAVESDGLVDIRYGAVISVAPLRIQITPDFILPPNVLMVPDKLCPQTVEMSDVSGDLEEVTWYWHNGLEVGDQVALIRESGGGKYYILDRYSPATPMLDNHEPPD